METLRNFIKDESGLSAVEYAFLLSLIAVGLVGFFELDFLTYWTTIF